LLHIKCTDFVKENFSLIFCKNKSIDVNCGFLYRPVSGFLFEGFTRIRFVQMFIEYFFLGNKKFIQMICEFSSNGIHQKFWKLIIRKGLKN